MRRRTPPQQRCLVKSCGAPIERWKRLCGACWRRASPERRRAIADAGRDRAAHIVSAEALAAAVEIEAAKRAAAAQAARICGSE